MYMDAYLGLAAVQHQQGDDAVDAAQPEMSCSLIETVVKKLSKPHKGHRCIMEQEHAYLDEIIVAIKHEGGKMRVGCSCPDFGVDVVESILKLNYSILAT
jgi:hypothetical protein